MTCAAVRARRRAARAAQQVSSGPAHSSPSMVDRKDPMSRVISAVVLSLPPARRTAVSPARPSSSGRRETGRGARSRRSRLAPSGPMSARRVRHQDTAVAPPTTPTAVRIMTRGEVSRSRAKKREEPIVRRAAAGMRAR